MLLYNNRLPEGLFTHPQPCAGAGGVSCMITSSAHSFFIPALLHRRFLPFNFFFPGLALLCFLPHLPACFFSRRLSTPPTFLPSLLRKTQGSVHRRLVFADFSYCPSLLLLLLLFLKRFLLIILHSFFLAFMHANVIILMLMKH